MNRLPTNHAIILGNVNFGFDVKTYHTQHHLTRKVRRGLHLYSFNYYNYHYDYNINLG